MIPHIDYWNPNRWPLYSYAPMRWRDWVMLPFVLPMFCIALIVLDLFHRHERGNNDRHHN